MIINANDKYEILAYLFYNDTRMLAPGKDYPVGIVANEDIHEKWLEWSARHEAIIVKTLKAVEYYFSE